MKINHVKKVLLVAVVLGVLVSFAGCDLAMGDAFIEEGASRSMNVANDDEVSVKQSNKQKTFTATVNLYQDYEHVVTLDMGNSNHHKTVEETLYSYQYGPFGGPIQSDWDLLDGKNVVMSNGTNYNLDPVTGEIAGSNHSEISIVDENGEVILTFDANGVLSGSLLGADITMNWVAKQNDLKIKARGKVTGTFVWAVFNYETMALEYILPNGTFTLTGTYN
ncbi:MAG: hypothetical protein WC136_03280 [Sphaerochaeta sp.]